MAGPPPPPMPWSDAASLLADVTRWDAATVTDKRAAAEAADARLGTFTLVSIPQFEAGGVARHIALFIHGPTGLEFALVPGGRFSMGSPPEEAQRAAGDGPLSERQHDVVISAGFLMCTTEVHQRAWQTVMGAKPAHFEDEYRPVEQIGWHDALEFCNRVGLALPTEAQWEYACRAGTRTVYGFGDDVDDLPSYAHFDANAESTSHRVGKKRPNGFGLHDMHGNVMEWCLDGEGAYPEGAVEDPLLNEDADTRVSRGGSWFNTAAYARCAARSAYPPDTRSRALGLRPVAPLR
jgi:formylglycine-generating enzyme required for sulfatase activity